MKDFFKGIGKAVLYFILFFSAQFLSAFILAIPHVASEIQAQSGAELDMDAIINNVTEVLLDSTILASLISSILTLAIVALVFFIRRKNSIKEAQINVFPLATVLPVIFIALSLQMLLSFGIGFLPIPQSLTDSYVDNVGLLSKGINFLSFISIGILVPITEEIIFRGLIFSRLRRGMPVSIAIVIQGLLFGILHGGIIWMAQAFILGVIFAFIAIRFKSIVPCIIAHMAINISSIFLNELLPNEFNDLMGYLILAVSAVVFVISMFILIKRIEPAAPVKEATLEP